MDEILVHFKVNNNDDDHEDFGISKPPFEIPIAYSVKPITFMFLEELHQFFEIVVFTATKKDYADWVLN